MSDDDLGSKIQGRQESAEELNLEEKLIGAERALLEALKRKDSWYEEQVETTLQPHERLSSMYLGVFYALSLKRNPHALSQAAHSARELIGSLLKRHVSGTGGGASFQDMKQGFEKANSILMDSSDPEAKQRALAEFFDLAKKVYSDNEYQVLSKKQKASRLFVDHELAGVAIPNTLLQHKIDELVNIHDSYFLKVTHGSKTSADEFYGYLKGFQDCLLGMFNLRYATELDNLIEEIEKGDPSD